MCNFFERLAEERGGLGKNQDEMANIGGVAKRTYCYYESGEREPGVGFLSAIAAAGADVQYIITGVRGMTVGPTLNREENAIVTAYRQGDASGKAALLGVANVIKKPLKTNEAVKEAAGDVLGVVDRKAS